MSVEKICTVIQTGMSVLGVIALGLGYCQLKQVYKQLEVSTKQLISDSTPAISMYLKEVDSNSFIIENVSDNPAYDLKIISYTYGDEKFCIWDKSILRLVKGTSFTFSIKNKGDNGDCFDNDSMRSYAFDGNLYHYISHKEKIFEFFEDEYKDHIEGAKNAYRAKKLNEVLKQKNMDEEQRKKILEALKNKEHKDNIDQIVNENIGNVLENFNNKLAAIYILYFDKADNSYIYGQQFIFEEDKITSVYTPKRKSLMY